MIIETMDREFRYDNLGYRIRTEDSASRKSGRRFRRRIRKSPRRA